MATVVLSAAGAAIGGAVGGGIAGVSSIAIGRLVGATAGRLIDQRIMGTGSDVVESGRVDRFRITGSAEGAATARFFGRVRVAGQVIWSTQFAETVTVSGGGKGAPAQPQTREYSYSLSLAVALGEGEILGVGRVWADGVEVAPSDLNMRVYRGTRDQLPDPKMEAVEGSGMVPAYRGTAYVVFEDLALVQFGNRVPQFNFEVIRATPEGVEDATADMSRSVRAVALMPGTGEYALATSPVYLQDGPGTRRAVNLNTPSAQTDIVTSLEGLERELPNCGSVSLVVSWFGDDLRAGSCQLKPKVEQKVSDSPNMPWSVAGVTRAAAEQIAQVDGRPVYGGTPTDQSVIEAITHMNSKGLKAVFYPFILMEQLENNGLSDPWTGAEDQPVLPWRGRITLSVAPGQEGSPDGTVAAEAEVDAFFGTVSASDFTVLDGIVTYSGPQEWSYGRFILHNAALCAAAGGVDAFCIGSEMRGLTQIRGASGFPAVAALRRLAAEVRSLLGPDIKIGYAADWSEYFGYHPQDGSGDVYFHLDPLWADEEIDFVGIDNYMPLSDWRDGSDHEDARNWPSIHDPGYLAANIAGGEGYDWYYHSAEAREAQIRTPITDGAFNELWVFRYKDIRGWWENAHHERIGGVRSETPTDWVPGGKPVWFTEIGCAAIDKGTNQPNKFLDPKSSESALPHYSNGMRDDFIQQRYLQTLTNYWSETANNPISPEYGAPMVDVSRMHAWAWDARPFPAFPGNRDLWSDGANYAHGHWITGRSTNRTLGSVVAEICTRAGVGAFDVSGLRGVVRGYALDDVSDARAALQPLMLRFGFDAVERDGALYFVMRDGRISREIDPERLAVSTDIEGTIERSRMSHAEISGRVRLGFVQAEASFETVSEEAVLPNDSTHAVAGSEMQMVLTRGEGRQTAERWLAEAMVARDTVRLALPPSKLSIGAGDVLALPGDEGPSGLFRVDRVEQGGLQLLDAVRIEPAVYQPAHPTDDAPTMRAFVPPVPVHPLFLDLPLMTGDEVPHAPHLAVTGQPWPGTVAVYDAASDADYGLNDTITRRATVGVTETPLFAARTGLIDQSDAVQVRLISGSLQSISGEQLLNGGNLAAIGDGSSGNWELFQFEDAQLVAPDTYLLSRRLRGQLGSDGLIPDAWPIGSWFVLLDSAANQIDLSASLRNIARHYRIGPAHRAYGDPSYSHLVEAFSGIGLRPYAPVHLSARNDASGNVTLEWIRRTRIDGDSWDLEEVPLGEEQEKYRVRVFVGSTLMREESVSEPAWTYTAAIQAADGVAAPYRVEVAQVSARFGPGLFRAIEVT